MALDSNNTVVVATPSGGSTTNVYHATLRFPGDDAYPTGGTPGFQAFVRARLGFDITLLEVIPGPCGAFLPQYDEENDTLVVRQLSDGAEVADTTNLSLTTFKLTVVGA